MSHAFDAGYAQAPFDALVAEYPGTEVYPQSDFRTEWGPIFHRGRLDGTARVLIIGQDPGQHESFARRILVGEAGQRVQGFLAKLGVTRSYVMINAFLYSVYGQAGGAHHRHDPAIIAYRNRWFDALIASGRVQAVVAFGSLARQAWTDYLASSPGLATVPFEHVTHPTAPEAAHGDRAAATKKLLTEWNGALGRLRATVTADTPVPFDPYGDVFGKGDLAEIPEGDLPAGLPAWMRGLEGWAARTGATAAEKRATLTVSIPREQLP